MLTLSVNTYPSYRSIRVKMEQCTWSQDAVNSEAVECTALGKCLNRPFEHSCWVFSSSLLPSVFPSLLPFFLSSLPPFFLPSLLFFFNFSFTRFQRNILVSFVIAYLEHFTCAGCSTNVRKWCCLPECGNEGMTFTTPEVKSNSNMLSMFYE